ncbi:hypothetical protein B7463_g4870, partial [Scytalidium lignicola]
MNALTLENEPKYLDPKKLTTLKVYATRARESILSHNQILWTNSEGYVKPGEEVTDLGLREANNALPRTVASAQGKEDYSRYPQQPDNGISSTPSHSSQPLQSSRIAVSSDSSSANLTQLPYTPPSTDPFLPEFFLPFQDPEMIDLFPNGEMLDFLQLETYPDSMDIFENPMAFVIQEEFR